tara:strand:- start:785 stop:1120 length:336 start_codon:yes stop_codon:yes gene_type:complete
MEDMEHEDMPFREIRKQALSERTKKATLLLVEEYAVSKCATYRTDSILFREVWANENPEGFTLVPYNAGNCVDDYTVIYNDSDDEQTITLVDEIVFRVPRELREFWEGCHK